MVIKKVIIKNFRNLENITIDNASNMKYIIGNNGIGKSNLLEAINYFFNKSSFSLEDFADEEKPIEIHISLLLNDLELGYFDDFFDLDNENIINIKAIQETPIDRIEYYHIDTGSAISYQKIRNLPCVYYNSINAPEELSFIKTKTSGQFLNSLIENYISVNNVEVEGLINTGEINNISNHLNEILNLISFVQNNDLSVVIEKNIVDLLPRLMELKNKDNMSINRMGSGVRYSSYIYFELLNKIMQTVEKKQDSIIEDNKGNKYISIFIFLDEPEIHLHPYMQRSVINDIRNIINNEDKLFLSLLKKIFNIDGIFGQLFVVTHSPNIISNNFREIIRLDYDNKKIVKAYSGFNCGISDKEEKQFLSHNFKIKEAFFAKTCIVVEGQTERVTLPIFANKIGFNFDGLNIGIIEADGADSIPTVSRLLSHFGIKNICIMDKDKYKLEYKNEYENIFHTEYTFFEEDFIRNIIINNRIHILYKIARDCDDKMNSFIQKGAIEKVNKRININNIILDNFKLFDMFMTRDYNQKVLVLVTWLYNKKSTLESSVLAYNCTELDIPPIYKIIISKAVNYAKK